MGINLKNNLPAFITSDNIKLTLANPLDENYILYSTPQSIKYNLNNYSITTSGNNLICNKDFILPYAHALLKLQTLPNANLHTVTMNMVQCYLCPIDTESTLEPQLITINNTAANEISEDVYLKFEIISDDPDAVEKISSFINQLQLIITYDDTIDDNHIILQHAFVLNIYNAWGETTLYDTIVSSSYDNQIITFPAVAAKDLIVDNYYNFIVNNGRYIRSKLIDEPEINVTFDGSDFTVELEYEDTTSYLKTYELILIKNDSAIESSGIKFCEYPQYSLYEYQTIFQFNNYSFLSGTYKVKCKYETTAGYTGEVTTDEVTITTWKSALSNMELEAEFKPDEGVVHLHEINKLLYSNYINYHNNIATISLNHLLQVNNTYGFKVKQLNTEIPYAQCAIDIVVTSAPDKSYINNIVTVEGNELVEDDCVYCTITPNVLSNNICLQITLSEQTNVSFDTVYDILTNYLSIEYIAYENNATEIDIQYLNSNLDSTYTKSTNIYKKAIEPTYLSSVYLFNLSALGLSIKKTLNQDIELDERIAPALCIYSIDPTTGDETLINSYNCLDSDCIRLETDELTAIYYELECSTGEITEAEIMEYLQHISLIELNGNAYKNPEEIDINQGFIDTKRLYKVKQNECIEISLPISFGGIIQDYDYENGINNEYYLLIGNESYIKTIVPIKFDTIFINDQYNNLNLCLDVKVTNYKYNNQEKKQDTLSGQYPIILKNGNMGYLSFSLSGLITKKMNDGNSFKTTGLTTNTNETVRISTGIINSQSANVPDEFIREKIFRQEVQAWLLNGMNKYFKSPSLGNLTVYLHNFNFTPKAQLNNMIWEFQCEAIEIAPHDMKSLKQANLLYKFKED